MADAKRTVGWEGLSGDDQDYFKNPHVHSTTRADYTVSGFSDAEKAMAVIDRLNTEGARKALAELDIATSMLDRYNRAYPKVLVTNMRSALSGRLKNASDTKS